jgi:hypothetical protein
MLHGLHAERGGDVALSGARAADQHDIIGTIHKIAAMERTDKGFIHLTGSKVEPRQILVGRELGRFDLVSPNNECPAVRQLGVGCLQLDLLAAQDGPVLAPVELEGLTCRKTNGTNVPRPLVCCSCCRSVFQPRTKAATRP